MADSYRDHCRDCIHFTPWPERVERLVRIVESVPFYPLYACMANG